MSNNTNYIQETEVVQQIKKFWQYTYQLKHIPTGKLYVGSRSNQQFLKKEEDCYTDKYLGSSSLKEGPFSEIDTETNPHDYEKTVLKVFYDADANRAWKDENGDNGLIMTYWNLYGKDKVLNQQCYLNDGSKVFSTAGISMTEEQKQKRRDTQIGRITITNGQNEKNIYEHELEYWLNLGWVRGRNPNVDTKTTLGTKAMYNDKNEVCMAHEFEVEALLKLGWKLGRSEDYLNKQRNAQKGKIASNKGKIIINNGQINKTVWKDDFKNTFEKLGWTEGRAEETKNAYKNNIQYYSCPHCDLKTTAARLAEHLKVKHKDEKQWSEFTKEEKQSYLVLSPEASVLIAN